MSFSKQYKSSLKVIEAEEIVDLLFFRPLAFLFVKLIYPTNITPNQVTIISMLFGVIAGVSIAYGTINSVAWGGVFFALSLIFDCADGQLARIKKNGTPFGRLLDGLIDYISSFSVFIGIGFWGMDLWANPFQWWVIVIITGLAYAVQAGLVDFYRSEYIANAEGKANFVESELAEFQKEYDDVKNDRGQPVKRFLLSLYIIYSKMQNAKRKITEEETAIPPEEYVKRNTFLVRFWNLNGLSTHGFVLIIFAFLNRLDWFIWYILFFGNFWTLFIWLVQKSNDKKVEKLYQITPDNIR